MSEHIDAQIVEEPVRAVAIRQEPDAAPPALFGTVDPVEVVQKAVRVADALKAVIVQKNLITDIQGKAYPQVEAWLTLAAMLRLTTICEWTRRVDDGWEARVYVRDAQGNTVGAAEAQCLKTERSKKGWEDYALRSMAQTRATSKSLRSVLGFIMTLAGYEATPSEEMPEPKAAAKPATHPKSAGPSLLESLTSRWCAATNRAESEGARNVFREDMRGKTVAEIRAEVERLERAKNPVSTRDSGSEPILSHETENAGWQMSDAARAALMIRHEEAAHTLPLMTRKTNDAVRHAWYEKHFGVRSSKDLTRAQYDEALRLLDREIDARNTAEERAS
jgi:hypothetical protein